MTQFYHFFKDKQNDCLKFLNEIEEMDFTNRILIMFYVTKFVFEHIKDNFL